MADTRAYIHALCLLAALPVQAATINVGPDDLVHPCRLRSAIQAANTDTAYNGCAAGSGTDTLVLLQYSDLQYFSISSAAGSDEDANATGDLDISSAIIIQGANPAQSVIVGPALDRTFDVRPSGSLVLNDLTVIGGSVAGAAANDGGVARKSGDGVLTVRRSVLRSGTADLGGAIYAQGAGLLTLDKVSIFDNQAGYGGGIAVQQTAGVEAVLNNVTLSGNTASFGGGGLYASSGIRLRNSTVARNRSSGGGGGIHYAGASTTGINIANSLLVDNVNANGGPLDLYCLQNAQLGSRTHSAIGHLLNCSFASSSGTPPGSDARLTPLFDFGAGLPVHALLPGSVALGAGNPSSANPLTACLSSDTRGIGRPVSCDLGAYEEHFDVTVNSFSDLPDLNPGDGICQATGNVCTLRAVAMEGSASRGLWFVKLPVGTYTLNRPISQANDGDGGDLDIRLNSHEPFQMSLFGMGDADDVRIVGAGFDRVLEVRGGNVVGPTHEFIHYPLAFSLLNATVSGGVLSDDPYEFDPNGPLAGGGIKVIAGRTLFYNVVVQDNHVDVLPSTTYAAAGGMYIDVRRSAPPSRPYLSSARMERFAIVDNSTAQYAGGLYVSATGPFDVSDGVTLINGTVAGNVGGSGGGAVMGGAISAAFLSIVDNAAGPLGPPGSARYGGGLTFGGYQNNGFRNVLIAGNTAGSEDSNCEVISDIGSSLVSLGHNLIASNDSGCVISGDTSSNLIGVNPLVGARVLAAGMPVHPLAAGSPAIAAVPVAVCADAAGFGVAGDARGVPRPGNGDGACDIGAVESELPMFVDGFES